MSNAAKNKVRGGRNQTLDLARWSSCDFEESTGHESSCTMG